MVMPLPKFYTVSLFLVLMAFAASPQVAAEESTESSLDRKRPISSLLNRTAGLATRPAVHRWRQSTMSLRVSYGQIVELNNFNSTHYTLLSELPGDLFSWQLGLRKVDVEGTKSSFDLGMTPYKQPVHPSRHEIIVGGKIPLMEGIASQLFNFIPQSQSVFNGILRLHFHQYPGASSVRGPQNMLKDQFKTKISNEEYRSMQEQADAAALPSRSRHSFGYGIGLDQYYPIAAGDALKLSASVIIMSDAYQDESSLKRWLEYDIGVGYDF